jgi:hypothetical protein
MKKGSELTLRSTKEGGQIDEGNINIITSITSMGWKWRIVIVCDSILSCIC